MKIFFKDKNFFDPGDNIIIQIRYLKNNIILISDNYDYMIVTNERVKKPLIFLYSAYEYFIINSKKKKFQYSSTWFSKILAPDLIRELL